MVMPVFGVGFEAMASACEVRLAAPDEAAARRLAQPAIDEVRRIEAKYSRYRADSVISRINAVAGVGEVELDAETLALFDYAGTLYQWSGGRFDPTSGVLRRAWDFRRPVLPSAQALAPLLALVGWSRVRRQGNRIALPQAGMELDLGGFGKEYAADRAATLLAEQGLRHGYVNLGGDLRLVGPQPDGQAWRIGIQDPRRTGQLAAGVPVSAGALATSGDYERFFDLGARRYCHILDPHTGMPVTHWRSVSVLGPLTVAAGSCATIAMLLQADGLAFLEGCGMAYLAIDQQGVIHRRDL